MLTSGTDPNIRNNAPGTDFDNLTALLYAIALEQPECAKLIVEKGADVNATNGPVGISPLHVAVMVNSPSMVEYLIAHGANLNAKNSNGDTPLHFANFPGHAFPEISNLLIAKGADVNIPDKEGITPKYWMEEARLNAEFKKQQEAARQETERKQDAASGKHRYGENAYMCISRAFINTCNATVEVTVNRNQFCNGGTFRVPSGGIISISQECKGFATFAAIYLGD
jgi:ankyrin repeat protein